MLNAIDRWFGSRIMHPPIILLCQLTNMTQQAVARYGWMLATWTLVMRLSFNGVSDWLLSLLVIAITIRETMMAALSANSRVARNDVLRKIVLILAALDVGLLTVQTARTGFPGFAWSNAWDLFALVAEYAKTIGTIPPSRVRPRASGTKASRGGDPDSAPVAREVRTCCASPVLALLTRNLSVRARRVGRGKRRRHILWLRALLAR